MKDPILGISKFISKHMPPTKGRDVQVLTAKKEVKTTTPDVNTSYKKAAPMPDVRSSNTKTRKSWRLSEGGAMRA